MRAGVAAPTAWMRSAGEARRLPRASQQVDAQGLWADDDRGRHGADYIARRRRGYNRVANAGYKCTGQAFRQRLHAPVVSRPEPATMDTRPTRKVQGRG